jgi:glyoxylate carboligase
MLVKRSAIVSAAITIQSGVNASGPWSSVNVLINGDSVHQGAVKDLGTGTQYEVAYKAVMAALKYIQMEPRRAQLHWDIEVKNDLVRGQLTGTKRVAKPSLMVALGDVLAFTDVHDLDVTFVA